MQSMTQCALLYQQEVKGQHEQRKPAIKFLIYSDNLTTEQRISSKKPKKWDKIKDSYL